MFITENDKLRQPTLKAFIENAEPSKNRRLEKVFPDEEVFDIDNFFDIINTTGVKAGSFIGFDAETPIRNKPALKQATVSLSKIAHAHHYTETELYKYFNQRNEREGEKIIKDALLSVLSLAEGINDTKELTRAQMAYNGVVNLEDPKTKLKIGFELDMPESAFAKSDSFDNEDVNPLKVLSDLVEQYKENNAQQEPAYIVMNSKTLSKIKRNSNVSNEIYGSNGNGRLVRDSDLNEAFTELGLPQLEVDDNQTIIEGVNGDEVVKHLADDKVVVHAATLGNTLNGPAADNNFASGKYVVNIQNADPISEKTIVGEVTMPVLKNVNGVVILDASGESTP